MKNCSDEDILQYVDGDMNEVSASKLRADIERDSSLSQRVDAMLASQLPYSMAYKLNPPPPIPDTVKQSISTWTDVARNAPHTQSKSALGSWKIASIAVAVGASFALGYLAANFNSTSSDSLQHQTLTASSNDDDAWVQRVADYQSLYVQETVGHIKNGKGRAIELLTELATKTDIENTIPDLSSFGYQFVRAQQLGFNDQPLVQLVYTSPGKKPLALCFMPSEGVNQSALTLSHHENLSAANWRTSTQRYVIIADESAESIESIAVHAQQVFL
jgi:anti-sigma factor RsiW